MKSYQIVLLILTLVSSSFAQIGASLNIKSGYASNIFANYSQLPDYYNNLQGYVNYDVLKETQGLRVFYNGDAALFEQYDYRSYQTHVAGLSYYKYTGKAGKLSAGLDGRLRRHTDDYKWYEYNQGYGYVSIKIPLQNQFYGYAGVNVRVRDYEALSPYSYWQDVSYVRLSRFFNSGTTIIGQFDYMQKQYLNSDAVSPLEDFPSMETNGDSKSRQVVGLIRVAQAVTPKTGLSAQILIRRNLNSSIRYLINDAGYYYSDEELFDDVFGYEAEQLNLTLKQRLPWKMQLSVGGTWLLKHYINRLALDLEGYPLEGLPLRDDQRSVGWLSLSKTWRYSKIMSPVTLNFDVTFLKNDSNDPYYNFNTRYFSFGLLQNF